MTKNLVLRYFEPAPRTDEGWETLSLPLGNGYFGASIFGGTDIERIQFTSNAFACDYNKGGVSNFAEIHVALNHDDVNGYERGLNLNEGISYSKYSVNGISIKRESFCSYPNHVFVYRVSSSSPIDFDINLIIPFLGSRPIEDGGRTGEVYPDGEHLVMRGTLPFRDLIYEGRIAVITDGEKEISSSIAVKGSKETTIVFAAGLSYKLCEEMFFDGCHKALGEDPHLDVVKRLDAAVTLGFGALLVNHQKDYKELMGRVDFDLGGIDEGKSTIELLEDYRSGKKVPYLEELYFQYGRYLLVSSSRKGTPPASLQGVWNVHDKSPWGSGFWHNINVQMNYWPAFSCNIAETFLAYAEFHKAYRAQASKSADEWIRNVAPLRYEEGHNGWIIGTGAYCYEVEGMSKNTHSGPGTGAMTGKLFYDFYDFTRDEKVLKDITYPCIHGLSEFFVKCVDKYGDSFLCSYSASPEQIVGGHWHNGATKQPYYHTVGCAFDQQLINENAIDDVKASTILGIKDSVVEEEEKQLGHYEYVNIGYSGQIKEYREEHFYGEIGAYEHRHISQLVALMPGTAINHNTPAWLDAARLTLTYRGDFSTGWALAHRLCAWSRIGDGDHAYSLLRTLLSKKTHPNLWDVHPPFQIDGNFGATAGIAEMLVQSHEGYISLLPALPNDWNNVSFRGLKTRGNFTVGLHYKEGLLKDASIESCVGGTAKVFYRGFGDVSVIDSETGETIAFIRSGNLVEFQTERGHSYELNGFVVVPHETIVENAKGVWEDSCACISWDGTDECIIFRAVDNDEHYEMIGESHNGSFIDRTYSANNKARITYKVIKASPNCDEGSLGALIPMHPADEEELKEYKFKLTFNSLARDKIP